MGVLQSIQQFSSVVDTFVQANSGIAALVWGSVKFTMLVSSRLKYIVVLTKTYSIQAASNFSSYFDKLSEWFMKLRNDCPIFSEYQLLYADAPRLQSALLSFYATVVRFCQHAIGSLQRTG